MVGTFEFVNFSFSFLDDQNTNLFFSDVDPEPNPKWKALDEILKEVRGTSNEPEIVLILVSSIETCRQLKDVSI